MYNYPCVVENAPCLEYKGHSSHVVCVRFSPDNRWVASVGGHDQAVFQWRVVEADLPGLPPAPLEPNTVFVKPRRVLVDGADGSGNVRIPLAETQAANAADGGSAPPEKVSVNQPHECEYEISVTTSDRRGAGTDANVFIVMYSGSKTTPELKLGE